MGIFGEKIENECKEPESAGYYLISSTYLCSMYIILSSGFLKADRDISQISPKRKTDVIYV